MLCTCNGQRSKKDDKGKNEGKEQTTTTTDGIATTNSTIVNTTAVASSKRDANLNVNANANSNDKNKDDDNDHLLSRPKFINVGEKTIKTTKYQPVINVSSSSFKPRETVFKLIKTDHRGRSIETTPTPYNLTDKYLSLTSVNMILILHCFSRSFSRTFCCLSYLVQSAHTED